MKDRNPVPYHEVRDTDHLAALVASMQANGYVGTPVVTTDEDADQALTGSHRIAAAEEVGILVDTISISEVFEEAGMDFDAVFAEVEKGNIGATWWHLIVAELPSEIREKYGIDIE